MRNRKGVNPAGYIYRRNKTQSSGRRALKNGLQFLIANPLMMNKVRDQLIRFIIATYVNDVEVESIFVLIQKTTLCFTTNKVT